MPHTDFKLDYSTPVDPTLQARLETIDAELRARHGMTTEHPAIGLLDFKRSSVAMIHPDRIEYAASVPKIGILLAFFESHPGRGLDAQTKRELGLMIKASSNEMATKYSRQLSLAAIQQVLNSYGLYDSTRGGGIWVGKHYGKSDERIPDPVGGHSHAATVRQLLRFYLLLEQGKLVSPAASEAMRQIFRSPEIPHDQIKFVKGLAGRNLEILRKWGSWENWLHDTAVISGPNRHYILVALTHHPKGDDYLTDLAAAVDDLMIKAPRPPESDEGGKQPRGEWGNHAARLMGSCRRDPVLCVLKSRRTAPPKFESQNSPPLRSAS